MNKEKVGYGGRAGRRARADWARRSKRAGSMRKSAWAGSGRRATAGPVGFVRGMLGEAPYDKQREILRAVSLRPRVSVVGCHGSGKDWAAARAALWWVTAHHPAKAIVTGPTERQIDDIVWNEMRTAHARAGGRLRGRMFKTPRYEVDEQTFALGFATSSPYNLQGFHSPNLLVVVTEAHAVGEEHVEALSRLNPDRLLMVGNAYSVPGAFYDSQHSKRWLYQTIRISAFDTPNVSRGEEWAAGMIGAQDVEARRTEWGEGSAEYSSMVLAEFPEEREEFVVPLEWARAAAERTLEAAGPVVSACDVARFGRDKTVVVRRQGGVARIAHRIQGQDTMQIAEWLAEHCERELVDYLVVDETGVGGGVIDRLRQLRVRRARLVPFVAGSRASEPEQFVNLGAEAWWKMRRAYEYGELDTEWDSALVEQVTTRRYRREGERIKLQSKYSMRRSPDEADALAMTFAVDTKRKRLMIWT